MEYEIHPVSRLTGDEMIWMVASRSYAPGAFWKVTYRASAGPGLTFTCTCPSTSEVCAHLTAVVAFERRRTEAVTR